MGPMAEAIYKSINTDEKVDILSRGLVVMFPAPINPKTEVVLGSHGLEAVNKTAQALTDEDIIAEGTLVLCMDETQREMFHDRYPLINAAVLTEYVGEPELEDPYGGTLMDYEKCFSSLSLALRKLNAKLSEEGSFI